MVWPCRDFDALQLSVGSFCLGAVSIELGDTLSSSIDGIYRTRQRDFTERFHGAVLDISTIRFIVWFHLSGIRMGLMCFGESTGVIGGPSLTMFVVRLIWVLGIGFSTPWCQRR